MKAAAGHPFVDERVTEGSEAFLPLSNNAASNGSAVSVGERLTAERGKRYGHPSVNYRRIGIVWQAVLDLDEPVPPEKVGLMLLGVKLGRLVNSPFDEDGWDDVLGYEAAQKLLGEDR